MSLTRSFLTVNVAFVTTERQTTRRVMKHITLRVLVPLMVMALITGCVDMKSGTDKKRALTAPPAPFAVKNLLCSVPEVRETNFMITGDCKAKPAKQYGIHCGDNMLLAKAGEAGLQLTMGGQPRPITHISYWGATAQGSGSPFKGEETKTTCDQTTKTITIKKKFHAASPSELDGEFLEQMKVLEDGLIDVKYSYQLPEGAKVTDQGLFFSFRPFAIVEGMTFTIDGKPYSFSKEDAPYGSRELFKGEAESIVFAPDQPGKGFRIVFPSKMSLYIKEDRLEKDKGDTWKYSAHMRVSPRGDGTVGFRLDIRNTSAESLKASDTFAGVNFWQSDRLHVPDYGKCRNLAQNSSFEAGLRYYALFKVWANFKNRGKPVFSVDENVAKFGNNSLMINAFKGDDTGYLSTFAIPVVEGKKYTVSFYAKGNKKGLWINTRIVTGIWLEFPKSPGCHAPTNDWTRNSFTITAPNRALTFLIQAAYHGDDPSGEGTVWIDGLQIEEGDAVTDYVEKPLSSILLTSNPDNFLSVEDKKVDARLKITAPSNTAGKVTCGIEDFFYRKIWEQSFDFKTDAQGLAVVNLPIEHLLGKGLYVVRADYELSNGYKDTDYYRISRMEFLKNTHKNKNIFATNGTWTRSLRGRDLLKRLRDIGFGSVNYGDMNNKEYFDGIAEYGIAHNDTGMLDGKPVIEGLRELESVSPELEKKLEDACYEKAKAYPWVNSWMLGSELEGRFELNKKGNFKDFAKLEIAFYKGVKRFDPNKKAYLGGSCNMQPQNGTRFVDQYLEAANEVNGKIKFDGVTIHPYRTMPENPDLDDDAAVFFAMLDKHGYKAAPVYWDEGIYYTYYNIPEWGLDPHKGCSTDHYSAGCPSYHMGWGERISAAYFARSWLVALKYQDRVKAFNGWCGWMYMDAYLTPLALQKIPNTLGMLLGNAVFKKDIRFAPETRCYVFEDEKQRPVAALWSYNPKVDRGYEESPVARFNFEGQTFEIIDLMENERSVKSDTKGFTDIPVTPFPVFIRGKAGELESLCRAIQNGRIIDSDKAVVRITAKPSNASELEVEFRNLVTREYQGQADIKLQDKVMEQKIRLKEKGVENVTIPMPEKIPFDRIAEIKLPVTLKEEGGKPLAVDLSFKAFAVKKLKGKITVTGNAGDWNDIPAIQITNRSISTDKDASGLHGNISPDKLEKVGYPGDHEAEYQMAWDDDNLYLRVNVTDDKFFHKKTGWYNDSLQVYIDTLCDARSKETRGFDGNDYNYDFFPNEDGTLTAFRRYAPEQQQAGGLFAPKPNMVEPEVKWTFKKTEKGYVYEIAFPQRLIVPLRLEAGSVSGFAIYINDHDGTYLKSALTTTPPGTGGYMNPHLYPVMVLVE